MVFLQWIVSLYRKTLITPSTDQTLHQFANLLPNWTLLPILTLLQNFGGFHRTLQRVWLSNRGRLLLRTPCPVPFGICICSNVETILSRTCHVYGPFAFRTSHGTSILIPMSKGLTQHPKTIFNMSYFRQWNTKINKQIYINTYQYELIDE